MKGGGAGGHYSCGCTSDRFKADRVKAECPADDLRGALKRGGSDAAILVFFIR